MATDNFHDVLTAAVRDLSERGFVSAAQIAEWQAKLDAAARSLMGSDSKVEELMRSALGAVYSRLVDKGGWVKFHPGIARWGVERVQPQMRATLDRFIWSNADLIKLNRNQARSETLRRFSGWASSIPAGGSDEVDRREIKASVGKAVTSLPFAERRCLTDQGHKLVSAVNEVIAQGNNAIAAIWYDHGTHDARYDARKAHLARSGKIFLIRGNWAQKAGLVKPGSEGYTDEIERPGELVSCRCEYRYVYNLRSVPKDMLTRKGSEELDRVRIA